MHFLLGEATNVVDYFDYENIFDFSTHSEKL